MKKPAPAYHLGMSYPFAWLAVAVIAFAPAATVAQSATPQSAQILPNARVPSAAQYNAKMDEVKSARFASRAHMLAVLTAPHRKLLAQIVSNLAVGPKPDSDAAVAQLNAALSPGESHAIIAIQQAFDRELISGSQMQIDPGPGSHSQTYLPPERDAGRILLNMIIFFMRTPTAFSIPRTPGQENSGALMTASPHP